MLAILLIGSIVALHVEEAEGVSAAETDALIVAISEQIANHHNADAEVIDSRKVKLTCPEGQRCGIEIVARTGATQVIYLRILGIPAKIRVIAESAGSSRGTATVDLPRARAAWKNELAGAIRPLLPAPPSPGTASIEPAPHDPPPIATTAIEPESRTAIGPWIAMGAGAAFGAGALVVGLKNRALIREGEMSTDPMRVDELRGQVDTTGLIANACIGAALTGVIGGVIWLILDRN